MELLGLIIFGISVLLLEFVVIPKSCKKKIYNQINVLGGRVVKIERLSLRGKIYCVFYILDEKHEKAIVRFNTFNKVDISPCYREYKPIELYTPL